MAKKDADLKILNEMMSELKKQGPLYKPGNYWEFFEGGILKQIKDNNLKDFRKWPGGTPSNIQSFGGHAQNRTGIKGFAILCVTIPPRGQSFI